MGYRYQGDYLYARRGGINFGGILKGAINVGKGLLGIPSIPKIAAPVSKAVVPTIIRETGTILKSPATKIAVGAAAAGAAAGFGARGMFGSGGGRRRTMNVLNPRALKRATKRLCGFRTKATDALHELGYSVHRTGVARGSCKTKKSCR